MATSLKPVLVHGEWGPNPPKVAMVLETLGIPYEFAETTFATIKEPAYLAVNPNGRLPAIYDPNTDTTLWESGAIIEYLVETYDKDGKISFPKGSKEYFHAKQWLFFQVSGQGPYYGQVIWFQKYHPETVPSAIDRYLNEVKRVTGVLESHLKKVKELGAGGADGPWLVGGKFSYADLSFVPWQAILTHVAPKEKIDWDEFPEVQGWLKRLKEQEGIGKVVEKGFTPKNA
ncbi:glutathione S-transferase [Byssothecium circinans]|uniref:Glutathione S-transferase n=1 Tax=Byssothecium circinans TaxID=147558 RepID=A0A6A5UPU1_9PLEO|nr:glutathione S-transferase [Byssothecium circinans]